MHDLRVRLRLSNRHWMHRLIRFRILIVDFHGVRFLFPGPIRFPDAPDHSACRGSDILPAAALPAENPSGTPQVYSPQAFRR